MSLKAKLEAIIYAAETPVTLDQLIELVKESVIGEGASDGTEVKSRVRLALEELVVDYYSPDHGKFARSPAGIACRQSPSTTTSSAPLPRA